MGAAASPDQQRTAYLMTAKVPAIGAPVFVALGVGLHAATVTGWRVEANEEGTGTPVTVKVRWDDEDCEEVYSTVNAAAVFSSAEAAALAMWGRA